jgi:hypothetical protein
MVSLGLSVNSHNNMMEQRTMMKLQNPLRDPMDHAREVDPITHWLDQSHPMRLYTGCRSEIHSYATGNYDAQLLNGVWIYIAVIGPPSCPGCRLAYNKHLNIPC